MIKKMKITILLGTVVFMASIAICVIARPDLYPSTVVGFWFLLFSEIVFFGGIVLVEYWALKSSGILTRVGIGIPLGCYALIVFISSLVYMNLHRVIVRGFLIFQLILLVVLITIVLIMAVFSKSLRNKEDRVLQTDSMVRKFMDDLMIIREFTDKKTDIDKVIEEIRFSDTSVMVDTDVELEDAISILKNTVKTDEINEKELEKSIKNIEFLTKKRKIQTRSIKKGGI